MFFRLRYVLAAIAAIVLFVVLGFDRYIASPPHFSGRCPPGLIVGLTFHDGYLGYLVCSFHAIDPVTGTHQRIGYVLLHDQAGPREHFFYDRERYLYYRSQWGKIYRIDLATGRAVNKFTLPVREVSDFCVVSNTPVFHSDRWSELFVLDQGRPKRIAGFEDMHAVIKGCGASRVVAALFSDKGTRSIVSINSSDGTTAELFRPLEQTAGVLLAADAATGELLYVPGKERVTYVAPGQPMRELPKTRDAQFSLGRKYIYRMDRYDLTIIDKITLAPIRVLHTDLFLNAIYEYSPAAP